MEKVAEPGGGEGALVESRIYKARANKRRN